MKKLITNKRVIAFFIGVIALLIAIFVYSRIVRNGVYDFDTCEKAGYSVRLLNCIGCPKYCDTPWGVSYPKPQK